MSDRSAFSLEFIERHLSHLQGLGVWQETLSPDNGPYLPLTRSDTPDQSAGYLRLWVANDHSPLDRMLHLRLLAGAAETQLLFVFGRDCLSMPHLHLQVVQFPPDGCVYNVDILPRVDPVYFPEWFERVLNPLRRHYRQATSDSQNSCAQAPANPALAVYMSPWGLASGRTNHAELNRVAPHIDAYMEHYIQLAGEADWAAPPGIDLRDRDARHMERFFDDELDPRAWNGVYRIIGEARGKVLKSLFQKPQKI